MKSRHATDTEDVGALLYLITCYALGATGCSIWSWISPAPASTTNRPASAADLALMAAMDLIHTELPFYGIRRIRNELRDRGLRVGRQHVTTLMCRMGIEAIAPRRKLSAPHPGHMVYPYLLRGMDVTAAGQVWCSDITYLPMARGFCYLTAVMDWASRRVLSWRLSNTLDASFCIEALEEALARYGAPEIFNTDQGSQFTSEGFTGLLASRGVAISMDGRGRWMDNVFHRTSLAKRQVRGGVPEGLREPLRGAPRAGRLLRLLQPAAPALGP